MQAFLPPDDPLLKRAWLDRAPSEAVAGWLAQPTNGDDRRWVEPLFPDGALDQLLRRADPFVDLAIAFYGDEPGVLAALWERGDPHCGPRSCAIEIEIVGSRW